MAYEKLAVLTRKLHERTIAGKIAWEVTALEWMFQSVFGGNLIQISEIGNDIKIAILNAEGDQIESFTDVDIKLLFSDPGKSFSLMTDIYSIAKRLALGTDQAIDSILLILEEEEKEED